jgi:hypothetical protein
LSLRAGGAPNLAGIILLPLAGSNFWMQISLLTISTFVGLNPNQPVPAQTIIDTFLGLIIGMGITTIVGRLIWPVLPQRVLRDDLLALFAHFKAFRSGDPRREKIQTQLAILPGRDSAGESPDSNWRMFRTGKGEAWRVGSSAANTGHPDYGAGFPQTYLGSCFRDSAILG